jgi:hypothetical protein
MKHWPRGAIPGVPADYADSERKRENVLEGGRLLIGVIGVICG